MRWCQGLCYVLQILLVTSTVLYDLNGYAVMVARDPRMRGSQEVPHYSRGRGKGKPELQRQATNTVKVSVRLALCI